MRALEEGRAAERLARDLLIEHGLEPLANNWRRRLGELDLVMREPASDTIVFVEVRYRHHRALGGGLASVDRRKRVRLRRAALAWLQRHADPEQAARIDVIAVAPAPCEPRPEETTVAAGAPGRAASGRRDDGDGDTVVAHRHGRLLEWIVNAVESDD